MKTIFSVFLIFLIFPYVYTGIDFDTLRLGPSLLALGLASILAAVGFCWGKKEGRRPVFAHWFLWTVGAYFIWRGFVEMERPDGVESFVVADRLLVLMTVLVASLVAWIASVNRTSRVILLVSLAIFALVNVGVAFYQMFGDPNFYLYETGMGEHRQATGIFGHHNVFASSVNAVAVYALAVLLLGRSKLWQSAAAVFLVMSIAGIALSQSRGGLIAMVVGFGLVYALALWRLHSEANKRTWMVALSGAVLLIGLMLLLSWGGRFIEENSGKELTSNTFRTELVHLGIELAGKEPLSGSGARAFSYLSLMEWEGKGLGHLPTKPEYAHNEYVQMLVDYGFAGFLMVSAALLAALFAGVFRLLLRDEEKEEDAVLDIILVGGMGGLAAFLAQCFFSFLAHIPSGLFFAAFHLGILLVWKPLKKSGKNELKSAWFPRILASLAMLIAGALMVMWGARHTEAAGIYRVAKNEGLAGVDGFWKTAELTRDAHFYLEGSRVLMEEAKKLETVNPHAQREFLQRALAGYRAALELNPYSEVATGSMSPILRLLGEDKEASKWAEIAHERFGVLERFLHNNWAKSQDLISKAAEVMVDDADAAERLLREAKPLHDLGRPGLKDEQLVLWREENAYLSGWLACREGARLFKASLDVWGQRQPEKGLALMLAAKKRYDAGFRLLKDTRGARFQEQSEVLAERIAFLKGAQITPVEVAEEEINALALGEFSAKP